MLPSILFIICATRSTGWLDDFLRDLDLCLGLSRCELLTVVVTAVSRRTVSLVVLVQLFALVVVVVVAVGDVTMFSRLLVLVLVLLVAALTVTVALLVLTVVVPLLLPLLVNDDVLFVELWTRAFNSDDLPFVDVTALASVTSPVDFSLLL